MFTQLGTATLYNMAAQPASIQLSQLFHGTHGCALCGKGAQL